MLDGTLRAPRRGYRHSPGGTAAGPARPDHEDVMRILLLTAGSRGDIDPFAALARRARAAGHEVRLAATGDVPGADGADTVRLPGDFAALAAAQGVSPLAAARSYRSVVAPMMAAMLHAAAATAVAHRPDVVVAHPKVLSAPLAAAHLGVPHVVAEIVPVLSPTRQFPAVGVTTLDLGPLNPLTYRLGAVAAAAFAGPLRAIRAELGLPLRGPLPGPVRHAVPVSPALLPPPPDWPATTRMTGQWHDEAGPDPGTDPELDAFLGRGDVLYAGLGSMVASGAARRGAAVVEAARATGRPVLVATGWGGLEVPAHLRGDDVLVRRAVPHADVLPRCSAAVHHGGAGTVHAVLRAGLPSVVVPFLADQPFWARHLHRRGLAAPPVPYRRLTTDRLTAGLAALPHSDTARAVGAAIRAEDGCAAMIELLEEVVSSAPRGRAG